jgi:hypothetical protein
VNIEIDSDRVSRKQYRNIYVLPFKDAANGVSIWGLLDTSVLSKCDRGLIVIASQLFGTLRNRHLLVYKLPVVVLCKPIIKISSLVDNHSVTR